MAARPPAHLARHHLVSDRQPGLPPHNHFSVIFFLGVQGIRIYDTYVDFKYSFSLLGVWQGDTYGILPASFAVTIPLSFVATGAGVFSIVGSYTLALISIVRGDLTLLKYMLMTNPLLPGNPLMPGEEPDPKTSDRTFGIFDVLKLVSLVFGSVLQFIVVIVSEGYFATNTASSTLTTLKISLSALAITGTLMSLFVTLSAIPYSSYPTFQRLFLQLWSALFYGGSLLLLILLRSTISGSTYCSVNRAITTQADLGPSGEAAPGFPPPLLLRACRASPLSTWTNLTPSTSLQTSPSSTTLIWRS